MKKQINLPIPVMRAFRKIGSDISDARRRRRITVALMAKRSGLSISTVNRIEKGDPATSIGNYAAILFVLGMLGRLNDLVDPMHDSLGRQLEDANLPKRVRLPKTFII